MTSSQDKPASRGFSFQDALEQYLPGGHDLHQKQAQDLASTPSADRSKRELELRAPQAELDLHGMNLEQARRQVDAFLRTCASAGLLKVVIIHGKGHHSQGQAVLRAGILKYLEGHPLAGRREFAPPRWGGSGATLVYLRSGFQRA